METIPFKTKKSYTIEQKIFILNFLNKGKSKHEIEKEFGIKKIFFRGVNIYIFKKNLWKNFII